MKKKDRIRLRRLDVETGLRKGSHEMMVATTVDAIKNAIMERAKKKGGKKC